MDDAPEGYGLRWVPDTGWRIDIGRPCRFTIGPNGVSCKAPSVAALLRGYTRPLWWPYCAEHLYGRRVRDGVVEVNVLRKLDEP